MKTLTTGLLSLALFAMAGGTIQADPISRTERGASVLSTRGNSAMHKRYGPRYYNYRPNYRPYYRPYSYGYRPYYRERVYRPYFYDSGPGYYFGTGAYRYYPQPGYGYYY